MPDCSIVVPQKRGRYISGVRIDFGLLRPWDFSCLIALPFFDAKVPRKVKRKGEGYFCVRRNLPCTLGLFRK